MIAAVNGYAAGGGFELALACDLIVAVPDARFSLPEVKLGLVADSGGIFRLSRRMPDALARELLLTGRPIDAAEAARWGIVNHVVERERLLGEARALAAEIEAAAPLATRAVKAVLAATERMTVEERIHRAARRQHPGLRPRDGVGRRRGGAAGVRRGSRAGLARRMSAALASDANRDKVALITGGGTGIGRATAIAFAGSGARVVICGRRREPLEKARAELERSGAESWRSPCDVREPEQVRALVDTALERFGAVDVLVNNAGGSVRRRGRGDHRQGDARRTPADVRRRLGAEPRGRDRSMIPGRGGLIVFVGFSPRRGIPGFAHAAAARAALENLAQGLALEWSRHSVRTVCVVLGNIDTEGLAAYGPEALERARRQVPLGRLGRPQEVGETIAFLATAPAAYITGSSVVVDGGLDAWGQGEPPPQG